MSQSEFGSESESEEYKNLCIICGVDIGSTNPRQYCYKTYCPMETLAESKDIYTHSYNTRSKSSNESYNTGGKS